MICMIKWAPIYILHTDQNKCKYLHILWERWFNTIKVYRRRRLTPWKCTIIVHAFWSIQQQTMFSAIYYVGLTGLCQPRGKKENCIAVNLGEKIKAWLNYGTISVKYKRLTLREPPCFSWWFFLVQKES